MKFRTTLLGNGKSAVGMEVPPEVVAGLGSSKKPAVKVTIKGYTYRSTVATMGGKFMVGVSAENREKAGVAAGDTVDVTMELDTEKREIVVPSDLATAMKKDATAKKFFDGLSYSNQRWYTYPIDTAKTPETRQRRVEKAITMLEAGKLP